MYRELLLQGGGGQGCDQLAQQRADKGAVSVPCPG